MKMLSKFLVFGAVATSLLAHDAKLHKGNATEGEVVSVTPTSMLVKTAKGNITATIDKNTKFEMGDQKVDVNHFKKGDKVSVFGTKLATGELVAKEIVMPSTTKPAAAKADHKH
jgi:hypothetical protein